MIISCFGIPGFAKSPVNIFYVTVEVPKVGNKPDYNASVTKTASTKVVDVEWKGDFGENGCFKAGGSCTAYVGVAIGTSDTTFSPGSTCTRGQIVTFLWRAAQKGLI